jgi:ferric-dicitrate binding protein FerR (iron transport regulator)
MEVNLDQVMAWKNGLFYFDDTNIQDIMQEIARWYNVSVEYKTKNLANKKFSGIMSRYSDVNALLKRMELTKTVHFEVADRTIIVMD